MTFWTVTANHLADGSVAYLRPDRTWGPNLANAWIANEEAEAQPLLEWARGEEHVICDPYLLELERVDEVVTPMSARERIRAEGPDATLRRLGYGQVAERERKVG